jgi:hypothetical protein
MKNYCKRRFFKKMYGGRLRWWEHIAVEFYTNYCMASGRVPRSDGADRRRW